MDWLRKIPIGQFVDGEAGWLRRLDPRLKILWVLFFLVSPVLSGPLWRVSLIVSLSLITFFSALPIRIWWRSFCLVSLLALLVGLLAMFLPTGDLIQPLSMRPPNELQNSFAKGPSWELVSMGPFQLGAFSLNPLTINRRSAELGLNTFSLIFLVIHSVNLMLITTPSEALVWALKWFIYPLGFLGFPVDRMSFQLLLSLRFLPLVQEELQSLLRALFTRAVNIRKLGVKATLGLALSVGERLLANILLRAEQGADAFLAKGGVLIPADEFRPNRLFKHRSSLNIGSTLLLLLAVWLRGKYGAL